MNINRGGIYLAALDPVIGTEISKTRPVLVVSNDANNKYAGIITVLPITSGKLSKIYPFEVLLPKDCGNLPKDSKLKANQIRTLDKTRLVREIGLVEDNFWKDVEKAVKIHLALI